MFKKSLFIVLMFCCTIQGSSTDQTANNKYSTGNIMLVNTISLAATYTAISYIAWGLTPERQKNIMEHIAAVAFITTVGSVIVEGMNCAEHLLDTLYQKNSLKESSIKKSLELNQSQK